ncbi:hypothetical protein [Algibacter sp. 2305UL17-15]|uniref:hypothetical protein n=1 Tax=Algibacter sp. 2305UL17-15 TaxID=3231268 RepID=UPI0034593C5A
MKTKYIIPFLLIFFSLLFSCSKKKCKVISINQSIIDTTKIKRNYVFKNQSRGIDSLIVIDYYNYNKEQKTKSLMSYSECGHSIGLSYKFRKESINIQLEKKSKAEYVFSINGFCFREDFYMNEKEIKMDSLYVLNIEPCHNKTELNEIAFKRFTPIYFVTKNGDKWDNITKLGNGSD